MNEKDKNRNREQRRNEFDDDRIKRDADGVNEPYNRENKDIEGDFEPRPNNPHTMRQSTMPAKGSNRPDDINPEHYYLNLNFDKSVVDDEQKLLKKYQKIIDALENVSDSHGRTTNDQEFERLVKKIDEAVNYHDTTLDVSESQIEYLSMSLRYIKDNTVREKLESAIKDVRNKKTMNTLRSETPDDTRKAGTRENNIRINPEVNPEEEQRRDRQDDEEGPVI